MRIHIDDIECEGAPLEIIEQLRTRVNDVRELGSAREYMDFAAWLCRLVGGEAPKYTGAMTLEKRAYETLKAMQRSGVADILEDDDGR